MINGSTIVLGVICGLLICAFFCYGVACGRQDVEKELRNQYTAALKHLAIENDIMRKELVEIYKKYDIDLDARLKILKMLREKKNDN